MPTDPYEEPSRLRPTNRELPPIGVGIDYGTIMGRGAGGARFFGEGTVRLSRGGEDAVVPPFYVTATRENNQAKALVSPGLLNELLATNYTQAMTEGIPLSSGGVILLDATTDGKTITSYKVDFKASITPTTPTSPLAPMQFKWPIYIVEITGAGSAMSVTTHRLIGASSLIARAVETHREYANPSDLAVPGYVSYWTWIVTNLLL